MEQYLGPLVVISLMGFVLYYRSRMLESHSSDDQAIKDFVADLGWRMVSVERNDNYWRYWIRGKSISNCSRIYVVVAEEPGGVEHEVHVAFDQWMRAGDLQVLLEK